MYDIIVHDSRLLGDSPAEPGVIQVGRQTPLQQMIARVRNAANVHGTEVRVKIFAHGIYADVNRPDTGGYGIELCRENLTLGTVKQLQSWNGYVSYGIDVYSCGAANLAPWRVGLDGDGWLLCSRIALLTGTTVRAALLPQLYHHFGGILGLFRMPIDFGGWEGVVLTFDARGREVDRQVNSAR